MAEDYTKMEAAERAAQEKHEKARKAAEAVPSEKPTPPGGQQISREDATAEKPDEKK